MFLLTLRYANITLFIPSVKNTSFRFALSFCSFSNNYVRISQHSTFPIDIFKYNFQQVQTHTFLTTQCIRIPFRISHDSTFNPAF
jgi:hypothetical protein